MNAHIYKNETEDQTTGQPQAKTKSKENQNL